MITFIFIIVLIFVLSLSNYKYKKILNINFIVTLIWAFFAVISQFSPYGLIKPSLNVHILIMIFLISFNIPLLINFKAQKHSWSHKINIKI